MTWHELYTALERADPASEMVVVLYTLDGTSQVCAVEEAHEQEGHVALELYEEDSAAAGGETAMAEHTGGASDTAHAAVEAFHDLCERRGLTAGERELIWQSMAAVCSAQVRRRQGPFYEAMKPLMATGAP